MISFLIFLIVFGVLAYHRAALLVWTLAFILLLIFSFAVYGVTTSNIIVTLIFLTLFIPLNLRFLRLRLISGPILNFFRQVMPTMSRTEREAINAGTITWEGDLFRGNPDWNKLLAFAPPQLTEEEQAFIDGPVDEVCQMINDWDISHYRYDMPPEMWQFLKEKGFFGLIIPRQYGGKQFSAFAHSQIMVKVSGRSVTVSSTISVPNSLGPAELLLRYGTDEQKNYYLPRLARGDEIPCFALTSPLAGSDAGSMTDHGVVTWGEHEGKKTLGILLNFDKRYITLAPVATVVGLAFKLYDPEHLLGAKEDIGITCALIPRDTPGMKIGRRHFPMETPFQNGPISGRNVFIPVDWIIGGQAEAGRGWVMLMECLAAGRAITLPSTAMGGSKVAAYTAGAYARIRRQFNMPIGRFEGIEEPLARIAVYTYIGDSARLFTTANVDRGEHPAVASAIIKYHVTELARKVITDAMDIHGGKGICLGPKNYIGKGYEATPIGITVEGANILTRCMIIFGQGAIRCHPYVLDEIKAARLTDQKQAVQAFDRAVIKHIAFGISNLVRSLVLGLTSSFIVQTPKSKMKRTFQHMTRFSSAFALISDVAMLTMGGRLKRKESISGRLGDILSYLYLLSCVVKHYHDQGELEEDAIIVSYASQFYLFEIQERFAEIIKNLRNRWMAFLLKIFIFPLGQRFTRPMDYLNHKIAQLVMAPTDVRQRLSQGAFLTNVEQNALADVQNALLKTIIFEPIDKLIKTAKKEGTIEGYTHLEQAQSALDNHIITQEQFDAYKDAFHARMKVIMVDDFSDEELHHN